MAKSGDIEIILLRSGRTDWDDQSRVQGRADFPLSDRGREEISRTIRELVAELTTRPTVIHTAPDEASRETAEILAEATDAKVRVEEELTTMDMGLWQGMLESEIESRFPSVCRMWQETPSSVSPPEGEPFAEFERRMRGVLLKLIEKANGVPTVIVARPLPYALAACVLVGRAVTDVWDVLADGPMAQRLTVPRQQTRSELEGLRARA